MPRLTVDREHLVINVLLESDPRRDSYQALESESERTVILIMRSPWNVHFAQARALLSSVVSVPDTHSALNDIAYSMPGPTKTWRVGTGPLGSTGQSGAIFPAIRSTDYSLIVRCVGTYSLSRFLDASFKERNTASPGRLPHRHEFQSFRPMHAPRCSEDPLLEPHTDQDLILNQGCSQA